MGSSVDLHDGSVEGWKCFPTLQQQFRLPILRSINSLFGLHSRGEGREFWKKRKKRKGKKEGQENEKKIIEEEG